MNFKRIIFAVFVLSIVLFNSCKETGDVGYSILPATDTINLQQANYGFQDGASLIQITNETDNAIRTDSARYSLVGYENDPVFGSTKASSYFSMLQTTNHIDSILPTDIKDSLILKMGYSKHENDSSKFLHKQKYYGSFEAGAKIQAYLLKPLKSGYTIEQKAYANVAPEFDPSLLAESSLVSVESQTAVILTFNDIAKEKIGKLLISNYNDNYEAFWKAIPGFYITTNSKSGNIHLFDIYQDTLILYTHNHINKTKRVLKFAYDYQRCLAATHITHDYGTSKINFTTTPGENDTLLYLQAGGGVKTKIKLGQIEQKLAAKSTENVFVNKARIRIKVESTLNKTNGLFYSAFPFLQIYLANTDGTRTNIPEYLSTTGSYLIVGMNSKGFYDIDVTAAVQNMLTKPTQTRSFYIVPAFAGFTANHLVLNKKNIQLEILYTKSKKN